VYPWFCATTVVATVLAFRFVLGALGQGHLRGLPLTAAGAVAASVFVSRLPSTTEGFFWMTSAINYQWVLITYLVWLGLLVGIGTAPPDETRGRRAVVATLTVLLPGFCEVMAPIVFLTLGGLALVWRRRLGTGRFTLVLLVITAVFTAVSMFAPGNPVRSATYPELATRHNLAFAAAETFRQTVRFLADFAPNPALWVAAAAAWWWRPALVGAPLNTAGLGRAGAFAIGAVLLTYLTLFPLYWEYGEVNHSGEGRVYNIAYFAFCALVVLAVASLPSRMPERWPMIARLREKRAGVDLALAMALALLMVTSPGALQTFRALTQAREYLAAQQAREAALRAGNGTRTVFVDELQVKPVGLFWGDIEPDLTHWINSCVARYYGVESVRTGERAPVTSS
jgi:hypothetical protein